jgi:arsenate reductase
MTDIDFVFKAMGDPSRIHILRMLAENGEMCVCKITEELKMTQSSVSHHLSALRNAGLVNARRVGQWSYYSLRGETLTNTVTAFAAELLEKLDSAKNRVAGDDSCCQADGGDEKPKKVIFVCIHNSGRSQMAEAFARRLGGGVIEAESAGTAPGGELNPQAVAAMEEIGYDMSGHRPKMMTPAMVDAADLVVTMGCGVNPDDIPDGAVCPVVMVPSEDWGLEDPKGKSVEKVREIRDEIRLRVERLIERFSDGSGR